ncbi:MAG: SDR family oxidoreductase [Chitinophagaceae bacterium]
MFRLDQKKAVITGGGSGIGRAIALLFARQGAAIHIIDLTEENSRDTIREIREAGGTSAASACDVTDHHAVKTVFESIGPFHILVNNAGIAHVGKAGTTLEADFDRIIKVNVKGVYNCLHAGLPGLKKAGGGAIINMCSIAALAGLEDRFAYSASKGAVLAMTMSVARDYLADNIRCNSISPARVHTPFVDGFLAKNYPGKEKEMFEKLSRSQPIGRMATPDEVAVLALYLTSNEGSFVTGNDYPVDGGFLRLNT